MVVGYISYCRVQAVPTHPVLHTQEHPGQYDPEWLRVPEGLHAVAQLSCWQSAQVESTS